jgi:hypothetical protein
LWIFPISTSVLMQLYHIEAALRGQFVWHRPARKKFQTNAEIECSADTALIVFIGFAEINGFDEEAVCNYLDIDSQVYRRLAATYRSKMAEATDKLTNQRWNYNRQDLAQRIWMKSNLVRRGIEIQLVMQ